MNMQTKILLPDTNSEIRNTKIKVKDFDILYVEEWVDKKLELIPFANTYLKDCYEHYKKYSEVEKKILPLSKKSFSGLFRKTLKEKEETGQIRFYQPSSILVKGIKIKDV